MSYSQCRVRTSTASRWISSRLLTARRSAHATTCAVPALDNISLRNSLNGGSTTLSRRAGGEPLTWYSCGPTVYDSAHLGHARTYICTDIVRRVTMDYFDIKVRYAMGITDIDDKIIQRAQQSGRNWKELAQHFEKDFKGDMRALNVLPPDAYLAVTDHIPDIIAYIQGVIDAGYGYVASDGVYFSVAKLGSKYGSLGRGTSDGPEASDGISTTIESTGKRSPKDFALWKVSTDGIGSGSSGPPPVWESPWGLGRPGWHIECSAMTHARFGPQLDIHSGGIDLLFPHHTNEIAQWYFLLCLSLTTYNVSLLYSTAHNNCDDWTRYWVHTGHLHIDGCKMSKSLKNFISIKDYLSYGWTSRPADDLRIYFLHHKYHSTLHFSKDRIEEAAVYRHRIENFFELIKKLQEQDEERECMRWVEVNSVQDLARVLNEIEAAVRTALRTDYDTPVVMKLLADLVSMATPVIRTCLTDKSVPVHTIYSAHKFVKSILSTFGLKFIEVC